MDIVPRATTRILNTLVLSALTGAWGCRLQLPSHQDGDELWSFDLAGESYFSPTVAPDGTIYVVADGGNLYALDLSGALKWKFNASNAPCDAAVTYSRLAAPAVGPDGTLYFTSSDCFIQAVNAEGELKWQTATDHPTYTTPAVTQSGIIYVAAGRYLLALNDGGAPLWTARVTDEPRLVASSPVIAADGTIYLGADDNFLYAFTPQGRQKWKIDLAGWVFSTPAIDHNGVLYVGTGARYATDGTVVTGANTLYAVLDEELHATVLAQYPFDNPLYWSPVVASNNTILVSSGGELVSIDRSNGIVNWTFSSGTNATMLSNPVVRDDGAVLVSSGDHSLYALTAEGKLLWSFATANSVIAAPTIASDNTVLVSSVDHFVYGIFGTAPLCQNCDWPKFHRDNRNSGTAP